MGYLPPKMICICGKEIEESSPTRFICLYCHIKQLEREDQIEKTRRKCYCGNAKKPNEIQCYFCENKEVTNERRRNTN